MRSKVLWGVLTAALVGAGVVFLVHAERAGIKSQGSEDSRDPRSGPTQTVAMLELCGSAPATQGDAYRMEFANEREGWIWDRRGVWRTTDAGQRWQALTGPWSDAPISQVQFISASQGWLLAGGLLHRTFDGGQTWSPASQPVGPKSPGKLAGFRFADNGSTGWALGGAYRNIVPGDQSPPSARYSRPEFQNQGLADVVFVTHDLGKTWQKEQLPSSRWGYLWNIFVLDSDHAWITGIAGAFYLNNGRWKAMDQGGENEYGDAGVMALNRAPGGPDEEPSCIFFLNREQGWICNFNGYLAKSADGGRTWQDVFRFDDGSQILSYFWNLHFGDSDRGWALSHQGDIYETSDGGIHWSKLNLGVKATGMAFPRRDYGLVLAREGLFKLQQ
jgi:photosystem II stability/assembly factor-like uncharacterized protein